MRRRLQRLLKKLSDGDKPIIWLRAGPGTGKTRLLQALRNGAGGAMTARWRLLDTPSVSAVRAMLKTHGIFERGARRVVIASRTGDPIGSVLLTPRIYGGVEVIDDAALYLTPADCRVTIDGEMFAATGGWPVLVDAWASGSSAATREMLPEFLESEFLPTLPQPLVTAMFAAAGEPLSAAAVEFLFHHGHCAHPLLLRSGSETAIASSWVRDALVALRTDPNVELPKV